MSTHSRLRGWLLFVCGSVSFGACAGAPHQVPFNESDFHSYAHAGAGVVKGHASTVTNDGYPVTANRSMTVYLLPKTAYTKEIVDREYIAGKPLSDPPAGAARYIRKTQADDHGDFVFHGVPSGDYYVSCRMISEVPTTVAVGDQPAVASTQTNMQWIFASVQVGNAGLVNVGGWQRGMWH
ncbi:MAG TPA: hypothetical protein VK961_07175 [Chthoniobacter sp.]|nr:hypothetical protein [Chthoniobacter sp.]